MLKLHYDEDPPQIMAYNVDIESGSNVMSQTQVLSGGDKTPAQRNLNDNNRVNLLKIDVLSKLPRNTSVQHR